MQANKVGHLVDHVDVAPLEGAGDQAHLGRGGLLLAILATKQAILALLHRIARRIDQLDALEILRQVGGGALGTAADGAIPVDLDLLHGQRQHYGLTGVIHHVEPGRGLQVAGGIELQIAHAGIGLCPIGILHRNPALAVDGDVKIPPRGLQQAVLQVLTRPLRHGEHPRGQSFAKRLHAARLLEVRLEADGVGVGQVVATHSQAVHVLLGPGHGDIKQVIHGILRQTDDSRRTTAN
ncbi:hypothetical protein D3C86_1414100 [compost metagenome]